MLRHALLLFAVWLHCAPALAGETLRVLAWPGYADRDLVRVFEIRHDVTVEVTFIGDDDELWQRASSNDGANFDVMAVNTAELRRYLDKTLLQPVRTKNIPNTRNQLPRFRELGAVPGLIHEGEPYGIPFAYGAMGLIYNRQLVKQAPTSMSALWDPRWKGKVLAYSGSSHSFSFTALTMGVKNPFQLSQNQFVEVVHRLSRLRDNAQLFYSRPEEVVDSFRNKEVALVFANYGDQQVQLLRRAGADVGYVIPQEGALAWLDVWAVLRGARDRNLAEAWINHMLSSGVSGALTERQGLANTLTSMSDGRHNRDKLVWLEPVEDVTKRAQLWERIMSVAPRAPR
ncbi:extracellular solute-binding protein [Uliginosibacterium sp. H1]|uniref:extracellular solute-binding protein n=1 Tax=Uliginosibacterium sp. H1 TaxID=3114757 RepID=UPI002E16C27F|nr:extracellular solute-binding protein [Uliginosibacterium sp. H1]